MGESMSCDEHWQANDSHLPLINRVNVQNAKESRCVGRSMTRLAVCDKSSWNHKAVEQGE